MLRKCVIIISILFPGLLRKAKNHTQILNSKNCVTDTHHEISQKCNAFGKDCV